MSKSCVSSARNCLFSCFPRCYKSCYRVCKCCYCLSSSFPEVIQVKVRAGSSESTRSDRRNIVYWINPDLFGSSGQFRCCLRENQPLQEKNRDLLLVYKRGKSIVVENYRIVSLLGKKEAFFRV